jgi:hypothetical protein
VFDKVVLVFVRFLFICLMVLYTFDRMIDKIFNYILENQNAFRAIYLIFVGAMMSVFVISMFELAT